MEVLMLMTYTAFCWAVFKIFKLPLNKWTVPTAVLGGVVLIAMMLLIMNYNHPYSVLTREYFATTPVVPAVGGVVTEVYVLGDQPLKKGDPIFQIDPAPFKAALDLRQAELRLALQKVGQLDQSLQSADASVIQAKAERDRTSIAYQRVVDANAKAGLGSAPIPQAEVDNRRKFFEAAAAALDVAMAKRDEVALQLAVDGSGDNVLVTQAKANVDAARWELESSTVRAPTDGFVTQMLLRPGMMAQSFPLRPVATFVHDNERVLVGAFWQNSLPRIKPGEEAEVVFRAVPGKVFKAKVVKVVTVLAQGQLQPSGNMLAVEMVPNPGLVPVILELEEDLRDYGVPAGSVAVSAIYTEHYHHFAIIRKILIRMVSWQNFIFGSLH